MPIFKNAVIITHGSEGLSCAVNASLRKLGYKPIEATECFGGVCTHAAGPATTHCNHAAIEARRKENKAPVFDAATQFGELLGFLAKEERTDYKATGDKAEIVALQSLIEQRESELASCQRVSEATDIQRREYIQKSNVATMEIVRLKGELLECQQTVSRVASKGDQWRECAELYADKARFWAPKHIIGDAESLFAELTK